MPVASDQELDSGRKRQTGHLQQYPAKKRRWKNQVRIFPVGDFFPTDEKYPQAEKLDSFQHTATLEEGLGCLFFFFFFKEIKYILILERIPDKKLGI